jgi:cbb3-type cytochrome oxidase maturation protein
MTSLAWLLPAALTLGLIGLLGFLWALRNGQFDDLEGASWRVLEDGEPDVPAAGEKTSGSTAKRHA